MLAILYSVLSYVCAGSEALTGYRITVEARPSQEDCGDPDDITDEIARVYNYMQ